MGWWKTGYGDDIMGDYPADLLTDQLNEFVSRFENQLHRKPTWQELLDTITVALQIDPEELYVDANEISVHRITVETDQGHIFSHGTQITIPESVNTMRQALVYIASAYQNVKDRNPRLTEIASCLRFVLGGNPKQYLSNAHETVLEDLQIEVEESGVEDDSQ